LDISSSGWKSTYFLVPHDFTQRITNVFQIFSKQSWLWSEGERMRRRTSLPILQHTYGINSLELKKKLASAAADSTEHVDLLLTRVKGISQRVDTMHLNDQDNLDAACTDQTDEELSEQLRLELI